MRGLKYVLLVLAAALLLPSVAAAQGTLTGTVRDASGAVLPGVTVEANSPALPGAVRTVVTDNAGIYRIIELPPGTYSLSFSLAGFSNVKRDGLDPVRDGGPHDPDRVARRRHRGNSHGHRRVARR